MYVIGIMGSPRVNGKCNKLVKSALEGAASCGAEIKNYELIKYTIKYCMGCGTCYHKSPELQIGTCPLKDDVASILKDYVRADGYIFASPVYDMYITALMKTFYERKIALTYRPKEESEKIPGSRAPANFQKKASIILTANCSDEYQEVMGEPCFEAFEGHLMIEMIDSVDRFYVGGVENMGEDTFEKKLREAYQIGIRLVDEIRKSRK
ncbi:MAG: flavodoxin family protein [Pseudomonadota bacterium]